MSGSSALPESDVWGLVMIGCFISLMLFGIILAQVFTYFQNCERDELWIKLFVGILVTLDAANSAASMAWIYQLLIDGWGTIAVFESAGWPAGMLELTLSPIGGLVHLFFVRRIYIISGKRWITLIILLFSIIAFCAGIGTSIATLWIGDFNQFGKLKAVATVWAIAPVVTDITITVVMTYYLHRSKGNFEATDRLLDRIMQLTVQNCALTSTCDVVSISLFYASKKPYYFATMFLTPKLCLHSALSSLNARKTLRSRDNTVELGEQSLPPLRVCGSDQPQPQRPEALEFRPMSCVENSESDCK